MLSVCAEDCFTLLCSLLVDLNASDLVHVVYAFEAVGLEELDPAQVNFSLLLILFRPCKRDVTSLISTAWAGVSSGLFEAETKPPSRCFASPQGSKSLSLTE